MSQVQDFLGDSKAEELVSPLLLSLLDSRKESPDLVKKLLVRMLFLVEDRDTFLTIIKVAAKGAKELLSCLSSSLEAPLELTVEEALAQPAWVLVQSYLARPSWATSFTWSGARRSRSRSWSPPY